jgi:hypothetical protein
MWINVWPGCVAETVALLVAGRPGMDYSKRVMSEVSRDKPIGADLGAVSMGKGPKGRS